MSENEFDYIVLVVSGTNMSVVSNVSPHRIDLSNIKVSQLGLATTLPFVTRFRNKSEAQEIVRVLNSPNFDKREVYLSNAQMFAESWQRTAQWNRVMKAEAPPELDADRLRVATEGMEEMFGAPVQINSLTALEAAERVLSTDPA